MESYDRSSTERIRHIGEDERLTTFKQLEPRNIVCKINSDFCNILFELISDLAKLKEILTYCS